MIFENCSNFFLLDFSSNYKILPISLLRVLYVLCSLLLSNQLLQEAKCPVCLLTRVPSLPADALAHTTRGQHNGSLGGAATTMAAALPHWIWSYETHLHRLTSNKTLVKLLLSGRGWYTEMVNKESNNVQDSTAHGQKKRLRKQVG